MASITIHNQSHKTISLIPFPHLDDDDFESQFDVTTKLVRNIPAGKPENVELKNYYSSPVTKSQIHMLFRVGEEVPKKVRPLACEKLFVCTKLAGQKEWNLSLNEKEQVIVRPRYAADQTYSGANAAGPQDAQLGELKEEVQKLKEEVKALLKKIADLEERMNKFERI